MRFGSHRDAEVGEADVAARRSRSGCASPASARSGRSRCPSPARTRCWCARCAPGVSRGTETLVFRGGVPAEPVRRDAGAVPGGRLPGPVKYGYLNVGVVEQGPADAARAHGVLPVPAPDRVRRAGRGGRPSCPTTCRRRGRCSPARSRPPSTRCGTPAPLVGDRVTVVGAGMVGCCVARLLARIPGVAGDARRRRPVAGRGRRARWASTSRCPRTRPAAATWSCTPARPRPGCSSRSTCSRRRARSLDLSWYGDAEVTLVARRRVPLRPAGDPASQVGTVSAGPARPAHAGRAAGARAGPAARPGVRRAAHRDVARSRSCPT